MERVSKDNYYLDIAETVSERSTCLRRRFGSIIVKNDVIVSTGYNGAPRGRKNCTDLGFCRRDEMKIPRGERYELCARCIPKQTRSSRLPVPICWARHSICAARSRPHGEIAAGTANCMMCKRQIINAGIEWVVIRDTKEEYRRIRVADWLENDDSLGDALGY